ncbi:MAG: GNAT family N-acetyltransferase [Cyanobacteria bacterium J06639_1]
MTASEFICEAIATPDAKDGYASTLAHCFQSTPAAESAYLDRVGLENSAIVRQGAQLAGGLVTIPMGQWFGGQRVPMTGIASVAIAPEARGRGAALALMRHALHKLHADGAALSVLYPAVQELYRRVGYEQGGSYCGWEIETQNINTRCGTLPVRAVAIADPSFRDLYMRQARATPGHLDRHPCIWQEKLVKAEKEPLYAYLFGGDRSEGYLLYRQEKTPTGTVALILDKCLPTAAARQRFWAFWTAHRSQVDRLRWYGSAVDDLAAILPEQRVKSWFGERWLLRIIDVKRALTTRGYPKHLNAELHLDVRDEWIEVNSDRFILQVSNGVAEVKRGGTGALKLDIRGRAKDLAAANSGQVTSPPKPPIWGACATIQGV